MSDTYNRLAAGERLRLKRTLLGMTQEEMAERIGRVPKYYADIERGSCGMSVETLMALSHSLNMSLDYIIFGNESVNNVQKHQDEISAILDILDTCPDKKREALHRDSLNQKIKITINKNAKTKERPYPLKG